MIVSDSAPLIYLAKLDHLSLLLKLFDEVIVPKRVMEEIARGKRLGFKDAALVEKAKQDGWIKTIELKDQQENELFELRQTFGDISRADAAAIVLAEDSDCRLCTDDSRAVRAAEVLGVRHIGTLGIFLLAAKEGLVSKGDVEKLVFSLPECGFYASHDLLAEFLKQLRQI